MSTEVREPAGTVSAHGHEWPLYERPAFGVDIVGHIDAKDLGSPEVLAAELRTVLGRYGVTVRVYPVTVNEMSPKDRMEKLALDEKAAQGELV